MKRDLPPRLHFKDGGYYRIAKNQWTFLGNDRKSALRQHTRIEHGLPQDGPLPTWVSMPTYLTGRFRASKASAGKRGFRFELTRTEFDSIVIRANGCCEVTGIPFDLAAIPKSTRRPWAPSLDRIDHSGPYSPDNCRLVCCIVNWAMSDWGEPIFWKMVKRARRRIRDWAKNQEAEAA